MRQSVTRAPQFRAIRMRGILPELPSQAAARGAPAVSFSAQQEQLLFGDMVLERELGVGGMGKVHLYRSRSTGERFAVKRSKFREWS